jgi:hypothetical protein
LRRHYVEFGAEACTECTSRYLRDRGWRGLVMDGSHADASINLHKEAITADSIVALFRKHTVPQAFDHLTVDLDLNTWWVLHAVLQGGYRPRSITVEYNRNLPPGDAVVTDYSPAQWWGGDCWFGASIYAYELLVASFGYHLIAQDAEGVNLYAVHNGETGSAGPALAFAEVIAGVPAWSSPCLALHAPCPNRRWAVIPEGLSLWQPREEWYGALSFVTLDQDSALREDGKEVQVFTAFDIAGKGTDRAPGAEGTRLVSGCGLP